MAASAVVLIAPVAYHRVLFGRRQKQQVVRTSDRMAIAGLVLWFVPALARRRSS